MGCLLQMPRMRTGPSTQVRALTRNRTCELLVCGMMPSPLNHTGQGTCPVLPLSPHISCYSLSEILFFIIIIFTCFLHHHLFPLYHYSPITLLPPQLRHCSLCPRVFSLFFPLCSSIPSPSKFLELDGALTPHIQALICHC